MELRIQPAGTMSKANDLVFGRPLVCPFCGFNVWGDSAPCRRAENGVRLTTAHGIHSPSLSHCEGHRSVIESPLSDSARGTITLAHQMHRASMLEFQCAS